MQAILVVYLSKKEIFVMITYILTDIDRTLNFYIQISNIALA